MTLGDQGIRFVPADAVSLTHLWRGFLDAVSLTHLWRGFLDGFRDYLVPVQIDEESFAALLESEHVDLSESVVALNNANQAVGVSLLAVRGRESWCGGLGISPPHRRRGLGRALMAETIEGARARHLHRVRLECIDGNDAALNLYLGLGFRVTRRLDIFDGVLASDPERTFPRSDVRTLAAPVSVWNEFPAYHAVPRPWQQDLPSLRLTVPAESLAGFALGPPVRPDAYVLVRTHDEPDGPLVIVDAGSRGGAVSAADTLAPLVAAVAERYPKSRVYAPNVPADDPLNPTLRSFGLPVTLSQSEMVFELSGGVQVERAVR